MGPVVWAALVTIGVVMMVVAEHVHQVTGTKATPFVLYTAGSAVAGFAFWHLVDGIFS